MAVAFIPDSVVRLSTPEVIGRVGPEFFEPFQALAQELAVPGVPDDVANEFRLSMVYDSFLVRAEGRNFSIQRFWELAGPLMDMGGFVRVHPDKRFARITALQYRSSIVPPGYSQFGNTASETMWHMDDMDSLVVVGDGLSARSAQGSVEREDFERLLKAGIYAMNVSPDVQPLVQELMVREPATVMLAPEVDSFSVQAVRGAARYWLHTPVVNLGSEPLPRQRVSLYQKDMQMVD